MSLPPRGGAKQRLQRSLGARSGSPASPQRSRSLSRGHGPAPKGGARQRAMRSSAAASSSGQQAPSVPQAAEEAGQDFKRHICKLFLENKFSGKETVDLIQKALKANAGGLDSLSRAGGAGSAPPKCQQGPGQAAVAGVRDAPALL
eukprot:5922367-Lingulodinium_polyedra.AAC.1